MVIERRKALLRFSLAGYDVFLTDIAHVIEEARSAAARSVNAVMTATYWLIGRRIVEQEQGGQTRAGYGEALLERLSADLTTRFGRLFPAEPAADAPVLPRLRAGQDPPDGVWQICWHVVDSPDVVGRIQAGTWRHRRSPDVSSSLVALRPAAIRRERQRARLL